MLMYAIAHGGVRTHVRESAMKVDSRRKIKAQTFPNTDAENTSISVHDACARGHGLPSFWCLSGARHVVCGYDFTKILHTSYKDHVTNQEVRAKIQKAIGPHEDLLTVVKRRKLQWYGHVSRSSGLAKTLLQGTVKAVSYTHLTLPTTILV